MAREILKPGSKVVGYNPKSNQCYSGEISGWTHVALSRVDYVQYNVLTTEAETLKFPCWQIFTKDELVNEQLVLQYGHRFHIDADDYKVSADVAIALITQALLDLQ